MDFHVRKKQKKSSPVARNFLRFILLLAFGITFLLTMGRQYNFQLSNPIAPAIEALQQIGQPGEELLDEMRNMLSDMGYGTLNNEELIELREEGVTATYVSRIRDLGFEEVTLEDAVRLQQAGVSTTFMTMMQELGYEGLSIDDFIRLRRNGVTAYYTSTVHDLGYSDVTADQLIRLQQTGVSAELIRQFQEENGENASLNDIIRYRISNQ